MADCGTRVIYVPGNHDEAFRGFCGRTLDTVEIVHETVHETADGRRFLVPHGDRFDTVITCAKWLAQLGDWTYDWAIQFNEILGAVRRALGLPHWSLSAWLKHKVKNAVDYICRFEEAVARGAREHGLDGVVCGHIHHAAIRPLGGITYMNDGDWVESCTALVEDGRGVMEILHWTSLIAERQPVFAPDRAREMPAPVAA